MKRSILILILILLTGLILFPLKGEAQMGPGMMGQEGYEDWNYCPYCGGPLGGPGMMGPGYGSREYGMRHPGWRRGPSMMGPGYGMGPGMMHRYWGRGPQYGSPYEPQYQQPKKPLEEKDVEKILENYLKSTRNPNLKLGKIKDIGSYFEAEILTKDDSLADKIAVDKNTGWMRSTY